MSQLFYLVPLLLFVSSLLSSSPPFIPPIRAATFCAPQLAVSATAQSVVAGEKQTLQVGECRGRNVSN